MEGNKSITKKGSTPGEFIYRDGELTFTRRTLKQLEEIVVTYAKNSEDAENSRKTFRESSGEVKS